MSNKGSSASFVCIKKSAIISRLSLVTVTLFVIFSLISCESGTYSERTPELLYTHEYDSIAYKELGGWGYQYPASIDFSNSDNAIISYEYRSNVDFTYQIEIFSNSLVLSYVNYIHPLLESEIYITVVDTIKLYNKGPADNFQITFYQIPWVDSNRYSVVKNVKIYSN